MYRLFCNSFDHAVFAETRGTACRPAVRGIELACGKVCVGCWQASGDGPRRVPRSGAWPGSAPASGPKRARESVRRRPVHANDPTTPRGSRRISATSIKSLRRFGSCRFLIATLVLAAWPGVAVEVPSNGYLDSSGRARTDTRRSTNFRAPGASCIQRRRLALASHQSPQRV
jgi:hypothetical protein